MYSFMFGASLVAQLIKNPPAMWETWVRSLGRDDPLEKEMANHSSILAWKIPWTEEPGGLQSTGLQRFGHHWATNTTQLQLGLLHPAEKPRVRLKSSVGCTETDPPSQPWMAKAEERERQCSIKETTKEWKKVTIRVGWQQWQRDREPPSLGLTCSL